MLAFQRTSSQNIGGRKLFSRSLVPPRRLHLPSLVQILNSITGDNHACSFLSLLSGLDGKLKGKFSPQEEYRNSVSKSDQKKVDFSDQRILDLYSVNPFNAWVTAKGLTFFAPYSMNKTVECTDAIEGEIIASTLSTTQINLYFLLTDQGWVYVKYIKSGSCLTAAKLRIRSKEISNPQLVIMKNMFVISNFFP